MKTNNKTGAGKPAPRKHDPKWKDNTVTQRQQSRRVKLNAIAQAAGFASWSAFETACLNGQTQPTPRALDRAARCPNCKSKWDKFFCAECGYCKPPRQ